MAYYEDEKLIIRNMEREDARVFTDELTARGWHPDITGYMSRLKDQTEGKCIALSAVYEGCPAGYICLFSTFTELSKQIAILSLMWR